jgi:hypothetical protein
VAGQRPRPRTWRQIIDLLAEVDTRVQTVLQHNYRIPRLARIELEAIAALVEPVLAREGRWASPEQPRVLNMKTCPRGDVPDGAIYIGDHYYRAGYRLPRSQWFNRFKIDKPDKQRDGTRAEVIAKYRAWICDQPDLMATLCLKTNAA